MKKEEVMDYVMNTPGNTNPNVLGPMLGALEGDKLPNITPADAGKVLTASTVTEKGAVIAAEQTVTLESGGKTGGVIGIITNVDTSLMTNGATLLVTIDDTEYVVTYAEEPFTCGDYTISRKFSETELAITCDSGDTVVVSINLAINSGVWVAQDNRFIVTLTPTSETGGTMDKSNVEILEAVQLGKTIYFAIDFNGIDCIVQATLTASFSGTQYPSFNAYGIDTSGTTIINLYVDPSDEESYTFTMDAVEIGGGSNPLPSVSSTSAKRFLHVGADGETLEWADADGNTLPVVMVMLHYSYGPSGSSYWYTKDGSSAVLTYDELKALIGSRNRGEIQLVVKDYGSTTSKTAFYSSFNETYYTSITPTSYAIVWSRRYDYNPNHLIETVWVKDTDQFIEDQYGTGGQFLVTLTPDAEDFSGTMNKTVREINRAYMRGQKIVFRAMLSQNEYMDVDVMAVWKTNTTYPSFNAYIVDSSRDIIMFAFTGTTSDDDKNTYSTRIYALTPVEPDVNE